jgi:sarcosine oxidase subunit delta
MKPPRQPWHTEDRMLLITCPFCGARPELEFTYRGQAHIERPGDPSSVDDAQWTAVLYDRDNTKGALAERWRHTYGCGRFFNAVRNTFTDRVLAVYPAGTSQPKLPG